MKKTIFIFLILFIFISNIKAFVNFNVREEVPNMQINNKSIYITTNNNNQIVYSFNPFLNFNIEDCYDSYTYNDSKFKLIQTQIEEINLASYYGYNNRNNNDIKWYGITQYVIWKIINGKDINFNLDGYEKEVKELESLISKYRTLPSFSYNKYNYTTNSVYKIIDSNEVLNNYEILETNIDAKIVNNELIINTKKEGKYEIKFIRRGPVKDGYILYYKEGNQSFIYPGKISDLIVSITIQVNSGSITINKIDSENINRRFASVEGAVYGIYKDEELINTVKTNNSGVAYIDNLSFGKYFIKEISSSKGYKLDEKSYELDINNKNKDKVINLYSDVISGNLIINSYYKNQNNYELNYDSVFDIYDINDNFIGTYESKTGTINEKLEYGEYYIIQTKGISGYNYIDKFNISINEEKDFVLDLYNEKDEEKNSNVIELIEKQDEILVVEVPNTKKYDYDKFISIIFIMLGLICVLKSIKKTTHLK